MKIDRWILVALAGLTSGAAAEEGYDARAWHFIHDGSGGFAVYGADAMEEGTLRVTFAGDLATNPVAVDLGGGALAPLVSRAATAEVAMYYALPWRIGIGLAVPAGTREVVNKLSSAGNDGVKAQGLGDVRGDVKWTALEVSGLRPGVAFVAAASFPTGDGESWFGAGEFQPSGAVVVEERVGPIGLFANGGYRHRKSELLIWDTRVADAIVYGAGGALHTGWRELALIAEISGSSTPGGGAAPLEGGAGLRARLFGNLLATAGGNVGISSSIGTPTWRAFGGLSWRFEGLGLRASGRRAVVEPLPEPTPVVVAVAVATPEPTPDAPPTPEATPEPTPTAIALVEPTPVPTPVAASADLAAAMALRATFAKDSADVGESAPVLERIASVLLAHPEVKKVSVEGHADSDGTDEVNVRVSRRRAEVVRDFLISKGVESSRLEAVWHGESRTLTTEDTPDARAANRRVEFRVIDPPN